jgi:hypothetical protein
MNVKEMKFKNCLKLSLLGSIFILNSCATYHITTQSLLNQFAETQKEKKVTLFFAFPFFFPGVVTGNSLQQVKVLDKNEKECLIPVTNHTGVRITKKDGKRKTFYFNTLLIQDSIITGKNDHFIGVNIKPINLNNIEIIELQK